jgi:hypothetical protein
LKNCFFLSVLCISLFLVLNNTDFQAQQPTMAGLRSSTYGINPFPDTTWWYNTVNNMASRFSGASPSVIWILGYTTNDGCYLGFPNPNPAATYKKIFFSKKDMNEQYLDAFDNNGVKVWLQVEPGFADVETVIDLVFSQYGHHSCVIGFGVDVEWYKTSAENDYEGVVVTDAEAEAWSTKLKTYNKDYLLFTKHWLQNKMPPTFRTDIVFVNDGQIFSNMSGMVQEFSEWAAAFAPADVAFQFGYEADKNWWSKLTDPPKQIGDALLSKCKNISDLYWVDFTAYDIWPEDFNPTTVNENNITDGFTLYQNYPNPFNPVTTITFSLERPGMVTLNVFNLLGQKIENVFDKKNLSKGEHKFMLDLSGKPSGVYFLNLEFEKHIHMGKIVLLK